MSSEKDDDSLSKKYKDLEDKISLLDEKILFLFQKVNKMNQTIERALDQHILEHEEVKETEPVVTEATPSVVVTKEPETVITPVVRAVLEEQPITSIPLEQPTTEAAEETRPTRKSFNLFAFVRNEENLPPR